MEKKNRLAILAAATAMSFVLGIGSANAVIISGSYSITELYSDATNSNGGGPVITSDTVA